MKKNFKISILLGFIFLFLGVATLPHYGINWDTINHLPRGQAYLHYFLTGKRDFSDLMPYKEYWQKPSELLLDKSARSEKGPLRSYYENDSISFNWYMQVDGGGHPPLSDILSAAFNKVFFGWLKIINDIDSYRLYGIFLSASLVVLVCYWVSETYGTVSGIAAGLSLALYPLFWSESHFNTEKDIPETVFWSFFLYFIWKGFTRKNWKLIILSGLFFGLALGTKFNILFSVFVFIPWLLFYLKEKIVSKANLRLIFAAILALLIGAFIFYATWPYLWQDIILGTQKVIAFYKSIGLTSGPDPRFVGPFGINTYPLYWIADTTPIPILFFFLVGIVAIILGYKKEKYSTGVFFLLWLFVPIARVVFPKTNIYGGVRQIMEYIPALAIIAGVGLGKIVLLLKNRLGIRKTLILVFTPFVFIAITLYKIHPNENVFFNRLIGGLSGAKAKNIPSWGNSFGAAYRQGFDWINKNAEAKAALVFVDELMPNAPSIWVRPDILFHNSQRSGFVRKGEYAITLTYEGISTRSYYDSYLENVIKPVYEATVDGVAVLKVWKNDDNHAYEEYKKQRLVDGVKWRFGNGLIETDLGVIKRLSYIDLAIGSGVDCKELASGIVSISTDYKSWHEMKNMLPTGQISVYGEQPSDKRLFYSFLGEEVKYIRISFAPKDACLKNVLGGEVYELSDLKK